MKLKKAYQQRVIVSNILLSLLIILLAACAPASTPPPAGGEASPTVEATQAATESATVPAASPTPENENIPSDYTGFMVFAGQKFSGIDFNGKPLDFSVDTTAIEGLSAYNTSVYRDGLLYTDVRDTNVILVNRQGSFPLDYIESGRSVAAAVSPDGSQIAWAYQSFGTQPPGSTLWVANIDGSGTKKIDEIQPADNTLMLVFRPLEWRPDGRLIYGTQLTGIGGYILYDAWNSLKVYDPADGSLKTLVEEQPTGMCINSVSPDLNLAASGCNEIRIRDLATGAEISLPLLAEQNVAGSAQFSPSAKWVAYAVARSNPDNERSQLVVAASDGSVGPQAIQTLEDGDIHVLGWINEDTLLFSAHATAENTYSIWRINRDGSDAQKLVDGMFLGFIPK